jgi:hypothetical protein
VNISIIKIFYFFFFFRMNFTRMMEALDLEPFVPEDWGYIKEFVTVATPVATAMDCLQGDGTSYLGLLMPTIWVTKTNITKLLIDDNGTKLKYCKEVAEKMVASLEIRFNPMFTDLECRLASGFHPRFSSGSSSGWIQMRQRLQ